MAISQKHRDQLLHFEGKLSKKMISDIEEMLETYQDPSAVMDGLQNLVRRSGTNCSFEDLLTNKKAEMEQKLFG